MILLPFFEIPYGDRLAKNVKSRCVQIIPSSTVYLEMFKTVFDYFFVWNPIINSIFVLRSIPIANYNMNVQDACRKQLKNPSLIVFATAQLMKVNRIRFLIYIINIHLFICLFSNFNRFF